MNEKYHAIRYADYTTFFYKFVKLPSTLFKKIYYKVKKMDFDKYREVMRIVNEIRIEVNNYREKDSQQRVTFKAYYTYTDNYVKVRCRFIKKANENQYDQFKESVQAHTGQKCSKLYFSKGYCYFTIYMDFEPIYDYMADNTSVSIGTNVYGIKMWDWLEYPHCLCTGETGQGKSTFIRYLLKGLLSSGHEVWCVDGKCIDYANVKSYFKRYVANDTVDKGEIFNLLEDYVKLMRNRYVEMAEIGIYSYTDNPRCKPVFMLIDEELTIVKQLDKKEKERFDKLISDIILLGRACGFVLIITMQRADAKYLSGDMRDNFMFRIVLGKASETNYKMMFEEGVKGFSSKGYAWYMLGTDLGIVRFPFYKSIKDD